MDLKQYDLVIVGGGAAGLVAGVASGAFGARTAIVELDNKLGGECSWTGCVPSKALIHEASLAYSGCTSGTGAMENVRKIRTEASKASKAKNILDNYGVDIFFGSSSFKDNHTLVMGDNSVIKAKRFILCTGSSACVPEIQGLDNGYLTNKDVWDLPETPESMVIIGGGPTGTELAQSFHRLGTKVTLVHSRERLLRRDDAELAEELTAILGDEGLDIRLNTRANKVEKTAEGWLVDAGNERVFGQHLLIAVGRIANTEGLNLEAAGVKYTSDAIVVNKYLRTTADNIWAAGDCLGGPQFAHIAEIEAKAAVRNALFPFNSTVKYQGAPWATFTDPELAHLGFTEEECREKNFKYRVYTEPFSGDDRSIIDGTTGGRVKVIASPYGKLLGVHILGPRAGELINEFVLARRKGLRLQDIGLTVHVYPTLGMAVQRATDDWFAEMVDKPMIRFLLNTARKVTG